MKIALEPTPDIAIINGMRCRLWRGRTDRGVVVQAWIVALLPQFDEPARLDEFWRKLDEPPGRATRLLWRFITLQ